MKAIFLTIGSIIFVLGAVATMASRNEKEYRASKLISHNGLFILILGLYW